MQITHEHEEIAAHPEALHRRGDQSARRRMGSGRGCSRRTRCSSGSASSACSASPSPRSTAASALDYSYSVVMAEALGHVNCGGVPMAIGVQTDMARLRSPASAPRRCASEFLVPAIAGDVVGCIGVSEPGAGSDVASIKTTARRTAATTSSTAPRCGSPTACRPTGCACSPTPPTGAAHKNKSLIIVPMNTPGVTKAKKIRKIGMMSSDTGLIHFDDVRVPQRQPHRRRRHGLHLPDDAVPGGAAVGRGAARSRACSTASS